MVLGYASWVLPDLLITGTDKVDPPIRIFFHTPIYTNLQLSRNFSLTSLFLSGILVGWLAPRHWLSLGACTMILVILVVTVELILEIEPHHKLYGIEVMMYMIVSVLSIIGAWLGSLIRRKSSTV